MKKKMLVLLTTLAMLSQVLPALAENGTATPDDGSITEAADTAPDAPAQEPDGLELSIAAENGTCGDDLTWTLDDNGTLTISGSGDMTDHSYGSAPWYSSRSTIKSVVIQDGVTKIGSYAFYRCTSLTSVTIPDSVKSIGSCAFESCTSLTSVTIPDSVTYIGERVFYGTSWYNDESNWKNNYLYVGKLLLKARDISGSCTIRPDTVCICASAFSGCSALTSVSIPDSVTTIGSAAFRDCSALDSVYINDLAAYLNISYEDMYSNPMYYANKLYINNKRAVDVVIPDGVTQIPAYAFYGCAMLRSVTIPDSVTSIRESAFSGCSALTSVSIPDSVTSIGSDAFSGCSALTSVTIPDSVTKIGEGAFRDCSKLTSVIIPDSVTSIGGSAFDGCSALTSVTIGDSVTSIDWNAFKGCSSLNSVTIPENVTWIADYAFPQTTVIKCITGSYAHEFAAYNGFSYILIEATPTPAWTLDNGTLTFGGEGDMDNYSYGTAPWSDRRSEIKSIVISEGVTSVGSWAFFDCSQLESVTLADSVTRIGDWAFGYSALPEIIIPESVTAIGSNAIPKATVIKGHSGSYAQEYAEANGYSFTAITDTMAITSSTVTRAGEHIVVATAAEKSLTGKVLHIALYDGADALLDHISVPTTISDRSAYIVFKDYPRAAYAKVFVWDSIDAMIPNGRVEKVAIE